MERYFRERVIVKPTLVSCHVESVHEMTALNQVIALIQTALNS